MRRLIIVSMFALCASHAAWAQTAPSVGGFTFGMTTEEARSASAGAAWHEFEATDVYQTVGVERITRLGSMDYMVMLEFQFGRLVSAEFARPPAASSEMDCSNELAATLRDLEGDGLFLGERAPWEPASGGVATHTESGSQMRTYPVNEDGHTLTFANRRGPLFLQAQSVHRWNAAGSADPSGLNCLIILHFEPDPFAPAAVAADAPTRAELEAAAPISGATWIEQPGGEKVYAHYPRMALTYGIEGRVQLDCLIAANGRLRCIVASEEPAGLQFGAAALAVAQDFRAVGEVNGESTEGRRVQRTIRFRLGEW